MNIRVLRHQTRQSCRVQPRQKSRNHIFIHTKKFCNSNIIKNYITNYNLQRELFGISDSGSSNYGKHWNVVSCPELTWLLRPKANKLDDIRTPKYASICDGCLPNIGNFNLVYKKNELGPLNELYKNLDALSSIAKPSKVGIGDKTQLDESIRKSKEIDLSFCRLKVSENSCNVDNENINEEIDMNSLFLSNIDATKRTTNLAKEVLDTLHQWNPTFASLVCAETPNTNYKPNHNLDSYQKWKYEFEYSQQLQPENDFRVEFIPHKLIIYEKGDMFLPHQDAKHSANQVASLILFLPCTFEGGELIFEYENQQWKFDHDSLKQMESNINDLKYVLFYCDIKHEIKPVASGTRLVMTFDVCISNYDTLQNSSSLHGFYPNVTNTCTADYYKRNNCNQIIRVMNKIVSNISHYNENDIRNFIQSYAKENNLKYVCITLTHEYICDDLTPCLLKGNDIQIYSILKHIFGKDNVDLTCLVTHMMYLENEEECMRMFESSSIPMHLHHDISTNKIINISKFKDIKNKKCHVLKWNESEKTEKTKLNDFSIDNPYGNHGMHLQHQYLNAAVIIKIK